MLPCLLLLLGATVTTLFLYEESEASCGVVSAMLAGCLIGFLLYMDILPMEFLIPEGCRYQRRIKRTLFLLAYMLLSALLYPLVSRCLYPLRNRLLDAFERWYNKGR